MGIAMVDHQPDSFDTVTQQGDLFAAIVTENSGIAHPDADIIRERLHKMLETIQSATATSPWNERDTKMNLILFPQMALALPPHESETFQQAFQFELIRLGLAA
jgi:hypothetical protein